MAQIPSDCLVTLCEHGGAPCPTRQDCTTRRGQAPSFAATAVERGCKEPWPDFSRVSMTDSAPMQETTSSPALGIWLSCPTHSQGRAKLVFLLTPALPAAPWPLADPECRSPP